MKKIIAAVSLCAISVSCARHEVMTNTYLASPALQETLLPSSSFAVIPNTDVANPIFDQTVQQKLEFTLEKMGYQISEPGAADYMLQYNYDMEGKLAVRQIVLPRRRNFHVRGSRYYDPFWDNGFGYSTYINEPYTLYLAKLRLTVTGKGTPDGEPKVLWVGETMTDSVNPDLRSMIDYLIAASFQYFMKDTGKNKNVVLADNTPMIEDLRKLSSPQGLEPGTAAVSTAPAAGV